MSEREREAQARDFLARRFVALVGKLTAVEALCDEAERGEGIGPRAVDAGLLRAVLDKREDEMR